MSRDFARKLRREMTDAERILWSHLRAYQLGGCKFRRQSTIGPYVVDFVCFEIRLILELDGSQHAEPGHSVYDEDRTRWLNAEGFRVLRFWNADVLENTEGVLEAIAAAVEASPPSP